ncbi:sarcosine oxidase [Actinoplanes lutulentus]|uniref:Sarcosine oxidase n=1 Tax=Actinoplanes lutulentus TaxID=1287878 RepID=A0A327Z5N2_9ACTN|nr:FAD-binding oxidoreductase [Actinoplanes lutulentus]MBB2946966.1 sarcosine oxidase [Actinoplanes lutulentus]RAK30468.1 sarcosine oxidase [Actinoplanes lutulentus]
MKIAVIGGGVVGLSATVELARRGVDVVCYEPGPPMGERSAGDTRIFRLAHAYPDMVELAARSRRLFAGWSERAGEPLIDNVGTVVSGDMAADWASAMAMSGADHQVVDPGSSLLRLPATDFAGPALIDPAGGIIRVDRVRAFLTAAAAPHIRQASVDTIQEIKGARVRVTAGESVNDFDAALICAGAATSGLAAGAGIETPSALEHHVRFSFPLRVDTPLQCWITDGTYQHVAAPGTWSIGADVDPALVTWDGGREAAEQASLDVVTAYVARELPGVEPRAVGRLYCTHNPDLSDGLQFVRRGQVLAVHGENLFKFAPLLGDWLAEACVDGSTPGDAGPGRV